MCQNENKKCNKKAEYYCRICGLEYCEDCAELIDGYCDCDVEPNLVKIGEDA